MLKLCILLAVPLVCYGFLFARDQADWNGLKVTWGLDPFKSFIGMPRTKDAAVSGGWVAMDGDVACNANPKFVGKRYFKNKDTAVILLFDANGYIAGIQIGFPQNYSPNAHNYPFAPLKGNSVIPDGGNYYITAYFINPAAVCTGRTAAQFAAEGTGTGVWIQNGTNPLTDSVTAPMTMPEAEHSRWTKGACFPSMGQHFWYDISKTMDCNYFFPVFLLYNGGKLNGFGWAMAMDLGTFSDRIEHPPQSSYGNFMTPPPDCLTPLGTMTTMHIYLTDSALADTC